MNTEKAIFAAGCFWGIENNFANLKGVVATRVGYTGGTTDNPSYEDVCGKNTQHAEAVEVIFDPNKISYQDLVRKFFIMHSPAANDTKSQYRSEIFVVNDEQKQIAENYIKDAGGKAVNTAVTVAETFWKAEERHQKYYLKQR